MSDLVEFCSRNGVPLQTNNAVSNIEAVEEIAERVILNKIQPTMDDHLKRLRVINYLKSLLMTSFGVQVLPYGSVPLRTYIPDGDIDLTVFCFPNTEDAMFSDVYAVLKQKEHDKASPCKIKDVLRIDAEVKIVKCIVENFVVDISFNQVGGIRKFCFLDESDHMIGKNHLFKRSIILIKSWCYYESRILGASHSLISTYALEILVLHILQLFHSTLDGPIAVLYRFLDYYSTFDWENYCISITGGPLRISSLPQKEANLPETGQDNLLISKVQNSAVMDSIKIPLKHLNIVDPLKEDNNLGRSVSRGNLFRIRSALKDGAHKLGQIIAVPGNRVEDELISLFTNTLSRHNIISGEEHTSGPFYGAIGSFGRVLSSHINKCPGDAPFSEASTNITEKWTCASGMCLKTPERVNSPPMEKSECSGAGNVLSAPCATAEAKEHPNEKNIANTVFHQDGPTGYSSRCDPNYAPQSKQHLFSAGISCGEYRHNTPVSLATSNHFSQPIISLTELSFTASKFSKKLLDLNGDYGGHIKLLQHGQFCQGYAPQPLSPATLRPPQLHGYNQWRNYPQMNASGISYPTPSGTYVVSDVHLPTKNFSQFGFQPSSGRENNKVMWTQCQTFTNGFAAAPEFSRKSSIAVNNFHLSNEGKINSINKNSSHPPLTESACGNHACHLPERAGSKTHGVEVCGFTHVRPGNQPVPAIAATPISQNIVA